MVRAVIQRLGQLLRQQPSAFRSQNAASLCTTAAMRHSADESTPIVDHYDVIIVGGGPAGLTMACAIGE